LWQWLLDCDPYRPHPTFYGRLDVVLFRVANHDALLRCTASLKYGRRVDRGVWLAKSNLERSDDRIDEVGDPEVFEITLILTGPAHLHVAHDYSPDAACLQVLKELGRTWKRS
jgi:hypothetical protein